MASCSPWTCVLHKNYSWAGVITGILPPKSDVQQKSTSCKSRAPNEYPRWLSYIHVVMLLLWALCFILALEKNSLAHQLFSPHTELQATEPWVRFRKGVFAMADVNLRSSQLAARSSAPVVGLWANGPWGADSNSLGLCKGSRDTGGPSKRILEGPGQGHQKMNRTCWHKLARKYMCHLHLNHLQYLAMKLFRNAEAGATRGWPLQRILPQSMARAKHWT